MQEQSGQTGLEPQRGIILERISVGTAIVGSIVMAASYIVPTVMIIHVAVTMALGGDRPGYMNLLLLSDGVFSQMALSITILLAVMSVMTFTGFVMGVIIYRRHVPKKQRAIVLMVANGGLLQFFAFFTCVELVVYVFSLNMFNRF